MSAFVSAWAQGVIRYRLTVLSVTALLLLVFLNSGPEIPFDNATERYFIEGDPTLEDYRTLLDLYGDIEYLVVGFEAPPQQSDVFNTDTLAAIVAVSDFLEFHPSVTQLRSLTNFEYIHADGDDLSVDYLIDDPYSLGEQQPEIDRIKRILRDEPLAMRTLITEDFRHTRVAARVEYRSDTSEHKIQLAQDLYAFIEQEEAMSSDQFILHLSGYPLVNERFEVVSEEDLNLLIPIMIVLMIAMLYFSFRSLVGTLAPWIGIGGGILLVNELQSYLGLPHSTVDSALNPTLIIIGIGITVHVLVEYFHALRDGEIPWAAAQTAVRDIWRPAFFTAITTSAGFYSLSITRIEPVRDFALLGAIGPIALFLFALTTLPAALSYAPAPKAKTISILGSGAIARLTQAMPGFTGTHRKAIAICGCLSLAFSIFYLPRIMVDTNYVTLFKQSSPTRQDIMYFDEQFEGMMTLDIILDSGRENGVKDPEFLEKAEAIELWLEQRESLGPINSLADYLKEINKALNQDDPAFYRTPDSEQMAAQFLLLYDSSGAYEDLSDVKDFDERYARLIVPVVNMPASRMQQELDEISQFVDGQFSELSPLLTGTMVLFTVQDIYTAEGMVQSFGLALLVITAFFIALFRSFKYGLLSVIPSVLPIILTASFASMLGITMDLSMVIVGAMTMGIAVDDAIHVMSRYLLARRQGANTRGAIEKAMNESGRAVIFSSMVLVLGFSVLCFGSFTTVIYVGLFGSIIMSLALVGDLIILPAILYLVDGYDEQAIAARPSTELE